MGFVGIFIHRPLLAGVINCLILLFGAVAFTNLDLRPYPRVEVAQIDIRTAYPGAPSDLVQGFVTGPLQRAILGAEGISYFTSSTWDGMSTVSVHVEDNYDIDAVMTEVVSRVAGVRSQLPENAEAPSIRKSTGSSAQLWIFITDPTLSTEQLTEFFYRVLRPNLLTVKGAGGLLVTGERPFAMRVWLDPAKMAAFNVVASEVNAAIRDNNYLSEAGEIQGGWVVHPVRAGTDLNTVAGFRDIVIREQHGSVVRIGDIATVELASEPRLTRTLWNDEPALGVGIEMTPDSNPLELSRGVRKMLEQIRPELPDTLSLDIRSDHGEAIERALDDVTATLFEALAIVAVITLLFFGNPRSVVIMLVSIPLSLVGTFFLMWVLGYSLNQFTLLALVIAIGLVVDDTIVVVENIHRYMEEGLSPVAAALRGAREVTVPVISMSLTLVAVYLPIGFVSGITGDLIREFVFTLAGSVVVSGIIALTLSPMLSSRILRADSEHSIAHWLDERFTALRRLYAKTLRRILGSRPVWLLTAGVIIASIPVLLHLSTRELVPLEDIGFLHIIYSHPRQMNEDYVEHYSTQFERVRKQLPGAEGTMLFEMVTGAGGSSIGTIKMKPWEEREQSTMELRPVLQHLLDQEPGFQSVVFLYDMSPSHGGSSPPVQFVIKTTDDYRDLLTVSDRVLQEARASGLFIYAASDLKYELPQLAVDIDRDKAGDLGVSMQDIGTTLSALLGDKHINRFSMAGESYKVITRAPVEERFDRSWLDRYYVRTRSGDGIPLSGLVTTRYEGRPVALNQFNGLNSATLSMAMMPGVSLEQALDFLENKAAGMLPRGYSMDLDGKSRTFRQESQTLAAVFGLALFTIYLFLVAQYESLRDPLVVLVSVPMSIAGALLFLASDVATLSLFSQVGLITLVGLISKHGILIVDFAKRLQEQGMTLEEAVVEAASIRLRPILMTTAAIVMAVVPLILATGPGAVSRFHIGLVIAGGMTIGTLFTLFILPVVYSYIAERRQPLEPVDGRQVTWDPTT